MITSGQVPLEASDDVTTRLASGVHASAIVIPNASSAATVVTAAGTEVVALDVAVAEGSAKVNLLGLSEEKLIAFFATLGEPKFRAVQVLKWIHQLGADNFEDMSNVSKIIFISSIFSEFLVYFFWLARYHLSRLFKNTSL